MRCWLFILILVQLCEPANAFTESMETPSSEWTLPITVIGDPEISADAIKYCNSEDGSVRYSNIVEPPLGYHACGEVKFPKNGSFNKYSQRSDPVIDRSSSPEAYDLKLNELSSLLDGEPPADGGKKPKTTESNFEILSELLQGIDPNSLKNLKDLYGRYGDLAEIE